MEATLIFLVVSQATVLIEAIPALSKKLQVLLHDFAVWASGYFNISVRKITIWFAKEKMTFLQSGNFGIGNTLVTLGSVLATVFLTPVYILRISR